MIQLKKHFNLFYLFSFLISFIGGFIELYSLKTRGIFCAMQTGNLLNIFMDLIDGKGLLALKSFIVLLAFIIGCALGQVLRVHLKDKERVYEPIVLTLQIILLVPVLFIPVDDEALASGKEITTYQILGDCFLALFGAFHFLTFNTVNGKSYTPTMMTNMMKTVSVYTVNAIKEKDLDKFISACCYLLLVFAFVLGAVSFYLIYNFINVDDLGLLLQYLPASIMILEAMMIPFAIYLFKPKKS